MTAHRRKGLKYYGESCYLCGTMKSSVEIHHIDGDRTNNTIFNLIPLCEQSHIEVHAGKSGTWLDDELQYTTIDATVPASLYRKWKRMFLWDKKNISEGIEEAMRVVCLKEIKEIQKPLITKLEGVQKNITTIERKIEDVEDMFSAEQTGLGDVLSVKQTKLDDRGRKRVNVGKEHSNGEVKIIVLDNEKRNTATKKLRN